MHGSGLALLADGVSTCRVDALGVGMRVALAQPAGAVGRVTHIVRTRVEPGVACVALRGGLVATAWHPVRLDGQWCFPAQAPHAHIASAGVAAMYPSAAYVYSVAVEGEGEGAGEGGLHYGLLVDGTPVITLGHGVANHAVLTHPFYGTRAVLAAVEGVAAWCAGRGIDYRGFALGEGQWRWDNNEATGVVSIVYCGPPAGQWGAGSVCVGVGAGAGAGAGAGSSALRAH